MSENYADVVRSAGPDNVPLGCYERAEILSWIAALSDILLCGGTRDCDEITLGRIGGLIYALTEVLAAFDALDVRMAMVSIDDRERTKERAS